MRQIPSIEQLRQRPAVRALEEQYGRAAVVEALRAEADLLRRRFRTGETVAHDIADTIERAVPSRLAAASEGSLRRVINATGVIVHTNLGRAPLAEAAVQRVAALAAGYTNLEYDLAEGRRGRRDVHAERLICRLTGAAAAVVVNNNAAATMIALAALAAGREVVISRGELVEIGGGFRVPDVMQQSGALLREVGTTNRTRAADYAAAIGDRTALILRVHPSNFRVEGFTERPSLEELVALGRRFNVPVAEDLGSGWLGGSGVRGIGSSGVREIGSSGVGEFEGSGDRKFALRDEPVVSASIAAGADVVMFSGDKLLGGPQAGIVAGTEAAIAAIRRHPLMRALRVDKMTYAALEATLQEHAAGHAERIPVLRMIGMTAEEIGGRAEGLAAALNAAGFRSNTLDGHSTIGGGSAPGSALPTRLVAVTHPSLSASELEARLRALEPPIIARIEGDRIVLDLRTVATDDDPLVARLLSMTNDPMTQ
jgi:L-seryl-tRNA(Ser) seleniumtransferase